MIRILIYTLFFALGLIGVLLTAGIPTATSVALETSVVVMLGLLGLYFIPGARFRLVFASVCLWVVVRYIAWRYQSLPESSNPFEYLGIWALFLAEGYGALMLLLGLALNTFTFNRKRQELPADKSSWPAVDIFIPTYSEPLTVVKTTILAALDIEYPRDKLNVYVLDDGYPRLQNKQLDPSLAVQLKDRTASLQKLCQDSGAIWMSRDSNEHAKSGNLNNALKNTKGELVLILDADHVPTKNFLKNTVGFFVNNKKIGFVQTPHFFITPDPLEKNLDLYGKIPGENDMFYKQIQSGLDLQNSVLFCGSAAVLRREALDSVGGFSTSSITEDASTSLKLYQKGWESAYYAKPMVAGLQPESFSGFITQRMRWAVGMLQILLKQNPLFVSGLSIGQRLSYLTIVLFWLFPFARIVFFIAPLLSLFFNFTVYPIGWEYFVAFTAPYLLAVFLGFEKTFGSVRRTLTSEIYETLQTFYAIPALLKTLVNPSKPSFKVTPKGETFNEIHISPFKFPFYIFYGLTVLGLFVGGYRILTEPDSREALLLSQSWLVFNFVLLSACLGVLLEKKQQRERPRVLINQITGALSSAGQTSVILLDMNETSAKIRCTGPKENFDMLSLNGHWLKVIAITSTQKLNTDETILALKPETIDDEKAIVSYIYSDSTRWVELWKARAATGFFLVNVVKLAAISIKSGITHLRFLLKD